MPHIGGAGAIEADQRLVKAIGHPVRAEALAILNARAASPNQIARELGLDVGNVSYHVSELARQGCVELVDTRQRRGADRALLPRHRPALPRRRVLGEAERQRQERHHPRLPPLPDRHRPRLDRVRPLRSAPRPPLLDRRLRPRRAGLGGSPRAPPGDARPADGHRRRERVPHRRGRRRTSQPRPCAPPSACSLSSRLAAPRAAASQPASLARLFEGVLVERGFAAAVDRLDRGLLLAGAGRGRWRCCRRRRRRTA